MSKIFGVAGNPILHSKSPIIHKAILRHDNTEYLRIHGESFSEVLSLCRYLEIEGINVTAPFKEDAYNVCDAISDEAKAIRAVNTLLFRDNKIIGENTDVYGVISSLREAGAYGNNFTYLVVGAGGAAKSVLSALEGKNVLLSHRNLDKGSKLANDFGAQYMDISEIHPEKVDVIISTVSDTTFLLPDGFLKKKHYFLNAVYSPSALTHVAEQVGCRIISGERWLLHQAQRAAQLFYGDVGNIDDIEVALKSYERKTKPLAFIGMMGSGKSSVSKKLSELMNFSCIELDHNIEEAMKKSIPEIFLEIGEERFREVESSCLREIPIESSIIVACGGGIILNPDNQKYLKENFTVIWLYASDEELIKRLAHEMHTRPILKNTSISELQKMRRSSYAKTSDIVFLTDGHDIESVAKIICKEML